ncbi:hypothetical protein ABW19_dt0201903 [Dactylella cylindrospora]|nr:hypothetical protein ABW19_dt0201903 [Dactylella cylindrospora]
MDIQAEFAHPYTVLEPYVNVTVVSPKGGATPIDPKSLQGIESDPVSQKFLNEKKELFENTKVLSTFVGKADDFDAVSNLQSI